MLNKRTYHTKQKDYLLDIIKNKKQAFTIKDIYNDTVGKVGLTTIYRLIDKLTNENKLNKYISVNNITFYEYLIECPMKNHFYLKCCKCHTLVHIDCDCITDLFNHITKEHQFKPSKEHIIINGICKNCLNNYK